jgi:hypothetical protein
VSRFTTSVLLATALLGVLLWVVISIVVDLSRAPDQPLPLPTEQAVFDPALPRISNRLQFLQWLNEQGYSGEQLVHDYSEWLTARGYPEQYSWITASQTQQSDPFAAYDDAELLIIAGQGDLAAMHELAERSLSEDDPLEALAWYDRAIVSGSLYAMLRMADLITTLTDPALAEFISNPQWRAALEQLNAEVPPPRERALGWSLAAVNVGGYALLDSAHANRIENLQQQLDAAQLETACQTAQDYLLDAASARRAMGNAVFTTERPPVAVTVPAAEKIITCDVPVRPLVAMDDCTRSEFVGPGPALMTVWLCPENF